ncbi:hypothetical protein HMPREF1982_02837 [Clostridiales bacterium oral taxon 876 str. F0540]|nr:hypothetical protein HMPREF1982_02837 [Clostridiales bacterium oral taxon 876 str. F0540]
MIKGDNMKKLVMLLISVFVTFSNTYSVRASNSKNVENQSYDTTMKQDLLVLMMAYPEYVTGVQKDNNGHVYLVMKSGQKILYDDKKQKSFEEKLNNPDLQDMMEQVYPLTSVTKLMDKNFDPGRSRVYGLVNDVYGSSRQQIEKNLISVSTNYGVYRFNKNNKAAESLKSAFKELSELAKTNNKIGGFLSPCQGTYNYRVISGTGRLSPHAYGVAIDLASDKRDYWKWASPEQGEKRLLSYSKEVAEVFEKNNFVWGGKWGHFDILHFEYRPEIIMKARYFKNENIGSWYERFPKEDENINAYINNIEEALK